MGDGVGRTHGLARVGKVLLIAALLASCGDDGAPGEGQPSAAGAGAGGARDGTSGSAAGSPAAGTVGSQGGAGAGAGATPAGAGGGGAGASSDAGAIDGGSGSAAHDGIAARYPGDVGIGSDPDVIFADDFESYAQASDLGERWDAFYQNDQIRFATEPQNVYGGQQALELTVPQRDDELSNAADKVLTEELDLLHLRYCAKFDTPFDVVGSSHNGAMISAHYFDGGNATPGVPANGTNKFLVNLENWRGEEATPSPGPLNVYVYHPEQRSQWGDHFFPTGVVLPNSSEPYDFGADFVERPDITPELDRWYCYEYMLQANTPGERDGRIRVWLDGDLVADFGNLRLRDVDTLKIDRFGLSFHIGSNPAGETKRWFDNVVAATSYIGPVVE